MRSIYPSVGSPISHRIPDLSKKVFPNAFADGIEDVAVRIAFIDSERGSAQKYSPIFSSNIEHQAAFDVLELERNAQATINPEAYIAAIEAARRRRL